MLKTAVIKYTVTDADIKIITIQLSMLAACLMHLPF